MKRLEELRKEAEEALIGYIMTGGNPLVESPARVSFRAGWDAAVKELIRWHDTKKELPEIDVELQVMPYADSNAYDVMQYDRHGWWQKAPGGGWCAATNAPARWRYIHTSMSYEAKARTE